jgi:hypothetical protein
VPEQKHIRGALRFACPRCGGLGWERDAHRELDEHPGACSLCGGAAFMSLGELARRLDPKDGDFDRRIEVALRKVHKGKSVRPSTGLRLLELLEARAMLPRAPGKQMELAR